MERVASTRELNEGAVRAFISLMGGWDAYKAAGGRLADLVPLLDALPSDELSGLRLVAERMGYCKPRVDDYGEPPLEPVVARRWLTETGRAEEIEDELLLMSVNPDHISISALIIATSGEPQFLTQVYENLPDHPVQLSREVVAERAKGIIESYSTSPEAE